jgi:outer membrane protein assembly factor BamE (lipoprotein component of BamABCDE complex)
MLLFSTGCQTNELKQYEKLKLGMDKSEVIEIMGSPRKVERRQSQDHWVYKFYQDQQWYEKEVRFKEGKAIYLGEFQKPDEPTPKHVPEFVPLN